VKVHEEPYLRIGQHTSAVPKTCSKCKSVPKVFHKGVISNKKYGLCEKHIVTRSMAA
jgi:hypothetical protein